MAMGSARSIFGIDALCLVESERSITFFVTSFVGLVSLLLDLLLGETSSLASHALEGDEDVGAP
jgi:hypothetical protein